MEKFRGKNLLPNCSVQTQFREQELNVQVKVTRRLSNVVEICVNGNLTSEVYEE